MYALVNALQKSEANHRNHRIFIKASQTPQSSLAFNRVFTVLFDATFLLSLTSLHASYEVIWSSYGFISFKLITTMLSNDSGAICRDNQLGS